MLSIGRGEVARGSIPGNAPPLFDNWLSALERIFLLRQLLSVWPVVRRLCIGCSLTPIPDPALQIMVAAEKCVAAIRPQTECRLVCKTGGIMSDDISRVAVIGAGTIGASWAALFLAKGLEVAVYDTAPGAVAIVENVLNAAWPAMERLGVASGPPDRQRLTFAQSVAEAVSNADFVQESGPETAALKGPLLVEVDRLLPADKVIASSTSGFTLDMLREGLASPGRILVGHPFNPPHLLPLVEVVADQLTSPAALAIAMAFYRRMGKAPIHLTRSVPGHVANRLQAAIWREAIHLIDQGVASLEDVDAAVALGPGLRWAVLGPNATLHLGGGPGGLSSFIDKLGPAFESYWDDLGTPRFTPEIRAKLAAGVATLPDREQLQAERDRKLVEVLALLHGQS